MPTYRAPRGTRDLLPAETPIWTRLERLAADLATRYGYRRIETPLFEQTNVFDVGRFQHDPVRYMAVKHSVAPNANRYRDSPAQQMS